MTNKLTLHINSIERERVQQLAANLGVKALRGAGAGHLGSVSGLLSALNDSYADDPARTLTLLARLLQRERPDVFGYLMHGNVPLLVRWTAEHPASDGGQPVMLIVGSQDRAQRGSEIEGAQLRVPNVVTEEDLRWLAQGAFRVQRTGAAQEQDEVVLV
jgi:hypothetical protein